MAGQHSILEGHHGWETCITFQTLQDQYVVFRGPWWRSNDIFLEPPWLVNTFYILGTSGSIQYLEGHHSWATCFTFQAFKDQYGI